MRTLLTQSLAVLMPFNVQELNDSTGNYYGINKISKNVNIGNRKKLINGNGFVFGVPGSGKSFFCKMEMGSVFLSGDDEIIVIDPVSYTHLDVYKRQLSGSVTRKCRSSRKRPHRRKLLPQRKRGSSLCLSLIHI